MNISPEITNLNIGIITNYGNSRKTFQKENEYFEPIRFKITQATSC